MAMQPSGIMQFLCSSLLLLLLCCAAPCAGHAGLLKSKATGSAAFASRLAGVRKCLGLHGGDEMEVLAMKQRYGKDSFLVARPAGSPKLVAKAALHHTYEALLRGSGCRDAADESSTVWFLDVGTDDDELLALASSLGCGVSVLDPEVKDVRQVDMTRCMNEEPNRPFLVFQAPASNVTNPETLANITSASHNSTATSEPDLPPNKEITDPSTNQSNPQPASKVSIFRRPQSSLIGKPTMLNKIRRERAASKKDKLLDQKPAEATNSIGLNVQPEQALVPVSSAERTSVSLAPAANASTITAAPMHPASVEPMESGVMLDTLFARQDPSNVSAPFQVTAPSGSSFGVQKISVLKVTPRSETTATLKALQGARGLLESGRVQCLVTEMNFDLNSTEAFLNLVTDLELMGFSFAHMGSLDYSELEVTDQGQYEVFQTDSQQLRELFDTYKRIRSFDERSGFRVYSGSLSLDRKGHYFDYSDLIFACRQSFPEKLAVLAKGKIRFRNGVWWLEKSA